MTVPLTAENFSEITGGAGLVLVDCWAPWCRNCDRFGEAFRLTAARFPGRVFGSLNAQEQPGLVRALGIQHVPSLLVYRDGLLLFQQAGSYDEAALTDIIAQAESLDLNLVRAAIAAA